MKKRLVVELDPELHNLISTMAKREGKSIKDYVIQNILLEIQGCCIFCPACKTPVLNQRTIHVDGTLTITCPDCSHVWTHQEKQLL